MIGGHELRRLANAVGEAHENRRRFVEEVEGAGNDVAGRIDHDARCRAGAEEHTADALQAADGLDADHRRRHAIHGGPERRLLLSVALLGCRGRCPRHTQHGGQSQHHGP